MTPEYVQQLLNKLIVEMEAQKQLCVDLGRQLNVEQNKFNILSEHIDNVREIIAAYNEMQATESSSAPSGEQSEVLNDLSQSNLTITEKIKNIVLQGPCTAVDVAKKLAIPTNHATGTLIKLRDRGEVSHFTPLYGPPTINWSEWQENNRARLLEQVRQTISPS